MLLVLSWPDITCRYNLHSTVYCESHWVEFLLLTKFFHTDHSYFLNLRIKWSGLLVAIQHPRLCLKKQTKNKTKYTSHTMDEILSQDNIMFTSSSPSPAVWSGLKHARHNDITKTCRILCVICKVCTWSTIYIVSEFFIWKNPAENWGPFCTMQYCLLVSTCRL